MYHDAAWVDLVGSHQGDDGCLLGARIKDIVGIGDAKFDAAGGYALDYGSIGAAAEDFDFEVARGVITVHLCGVKTAVLSLGKPIEGDAHARFSSLSWWCFALATGY